VFINKISGDLGGDGVLSADDALIMRMFLVGLADKNEFFYEAADINEDGKVSAKDHVLLRRLMID